MEQVERLMAGINDILSQPTEKLISNYLTLSREKDAMPFNTPRTSHAVDEIKELFALIKSEALLLLPTKKRNDLIIGLEGILNNIRRIHEYKVERDRTIEQQQLSIGYFFEAEDQFRKIFNLCWGLVIDSLVLLNDKRNTGYEDVQKIRDNLSYSNEVKMRLSELYKTAQDEIIEKGISKHSKIFSDQADQHLKFAKQWKAASLCLVIFLLATIGGLFAFLITRSEDNRLITGLSSILVISLVSYCVALSVKNYFAHKHNETINRHKANCLGSYNTFIEGANEDVKATILQFATQTIYSSYNPGFLAKETLQSPSPILELIRSVGGGQKTI